MTKEEKAFCVLPWISECDSNCIRWNNLIAAHTEDRLIIMQWNQLRMSIVQVDCQEVKNATISALQTAPQLCQDVKFPEPALDIFEWSGKFLMITTTGYLKVLTFDGRTLRFLKDGKSCFTTIFFFPPPKKVLGACPINKNVLLVACALNGFISLDIYSVDTTSDDVEVLLIESLPLEKEEAENGNASAVMCICCPEVASCLMGAQSDHYVIMLVGLHTGSLYWIPFVKTAPVVPEPRRLYHAGRGVRKIISPKGSGSVFALLDGGVLIIISSSMTKNVNEGQLERQSQKLQFDIAALPGSIRTFCIPEKCNQSIICSDGFQSWLVSQTLEKTETISLAVKGVTGLIAVPNSKVCVATTKHNTFYALNFNFDFSFSGDEDEQPIQKYCDLETPYQYISELKEQTNSLVEVEASLRVEDSILAGVSAAARGNILKDSFSGRVLVYNVDSPEWLDESTSYSPTDTLYKFWVEVKNNSNIEFSANLWSVSVSVLTCDAGVVSKTVSLQSSFVRAFPFSTHVYVRLRSRDLVSDLKVEVHLLANLPEPDDGRWLSIPVMEEDLDLSYFVTVISDADKTTFKPSVVPIHDQINKFVQSGSEKTSHSVNYSINIPQHLRNVSDLMQCLLLKSKHRCEDVLKQLKGGTEQREFTFLFGEVLVSVTFNRTISVLTITSSDTAMVHAVKLWIIRMLAKSDEGDVPSNLMSKAKCIRSVLESEMLKPSMEVDNLIELHSELRNNVSSLLPL